MNNRVEKLVYDLVNPLLYKSIRSRVNNVIHDLVSDSIHASVLDSDYNSLFYRIQASIGDSVKRVYE